MRCLSFLFDWYGIVQITLNYTIGARLGMKFKDTHLDYQQVVTGGICFFSICKILMKHRITQAALYVQRMNLEFQIFLLFPLWSTCKWWQHSKQQHQVSFLFGRFVWNRLNRTTMHMQMKIKPKFSRSITSLPIINYLPGGSHLNNLFIYVR